MNILFRLLLTFNATSLLVIIFIVQKGYTLSYFFDTTISQLSWITVIPNMTSYFLYVLIPIFFTGISLLLSKRLGKDEFKKGNIISIEYANNSFLPSYLGYFFVALSVGSWESLWFVYSILFIFTFLSQALYFNPLFLVFGYTFYNVTTINGTVIFLISRQKYKTPCDIEISTAFRINNYTFIERS
ncbi:hypothetical protein M0L39_RS09400 [Providencia rettgeri]|uniref:hypothetical protein n=1 Tax=Providencia sp. PROV200 TaxID=2936794 RepID=UPI0024AC54E9|nr:hypothetical protein [Providencia rettgeri]EJD6600156.1 hypothetical protein [Providencia rettgeri]